jgi:hypothetical protein
MSCLQKEIPIRPNRQRGMSLVEATIVFPAFLFLVLVVMQAAMVFHAKHNLNYATYEAARAGTMQHAKVATITAAMQKALIPYYGGGRTNDELIATAKKVADDFASSGVRVEILSPTRESFKDFASPKLQKALGSDEPVIPNTGIDELACPRDVPKCASDPKKNASGQTLLDANLLKIRITYGIPKAKQLPLAGRVYSWALKVLKSGEGDAFKQSLLDAGRIPIVTHTVLRMQSDAILNSAMVSSPGKGNEGKAVDPSPPASAPGSGPGTGPSEGGDTSPTLPTCPYWDPACTSCESGTCESEVCPG